MNIPLPKNQSAQTARDIVSILREAGYQAYFAGGSVRDLLLGRIPADYDIATSASPESVERLFEKVIAVGKQFGIQVVIVNGISFEVATFRKDIGGTDQRRPDEVVWSDAGEDANRRDFTINALFYDPMSGEVIDYVDGLADIKSKTLRFVGQPDQRIKEDHLRVLRAVRFKNTLELSYETETLAAIRAASNDLSGISYERIRDELDLIWTDSHRAAALRELLELGILATVLPEIAALVGIEQPKQYHTEGDVFEHTVEALASLPADAPSFLVWAVLFHDAGKAQTIRYPDEHSDRIRFDGHSSAGASIARIVCRRFNMSRTEIDTIAWLVEHHMSLMGIEQMTEGKRRAYLLDPRFKWLLELNHADAAGTKPRDLSLYEQVKVFYEKYLALWHQEQEQGAPEPLIKGNDLQIELGLSEGPMIGELLEQIRHAQLDRQLTTRADALNYARKILEEK